MTLLAAFWWLPESHTPREASVARNSTFLHWQGVAREIGSLLGLSVLSQFALALFETVFVLYAQAKFGYGPSQVGIAFMVCGSVMALFQGIAAGYLAGRLAANTQLTIGFVLMGAGIGLLLLVQTQPLVFGTIGVLALGMAFISPNLSILTSEQSGDRVGTALGLQNTANNLGQVAGPVLGGALFAWNVGIPYRSTSLMLLATAAVIGWHRHGKRNSGIPTCGVGGGLTDQG